ncbi:MAG: hypothetical protein AB1757_12415 [Acidobacteriota bacterium]
MATGQFEGRVEHMASYHATHFHSLDELLDFIAMMLTEVNYPEYGNHSVIEQSSGK